MRAMVILSRLALPSSIKKRSQDADGLSVRSVHHTKEPTISLRDAAECAKNTGSSWIDLKGMWFADGCLNPCSVDLALDQHFLRMSREYEAKTCHRSDPKGVRFEATRR